MKKFIVLLLLAISCNVYAADLTDQTEDTTPTSDDLMYTVNNPAVTPADRKVTLGNAAKAMTVTNMVSACTDAQVLGGNAAGTGVECQADVDTDTNTNAGTICAGTTTYLDGEGTCDDISAVYAAVLGADDNYVTDAEKTVIGNTSGTNTGDQAAGAGLSGTSTLATASSETDFLISGALTCGAGTRGKVQIHTTPLQYCDNAATPTLQYAAYGSSTGVATSAATANAGDSATAFFSSGTIEDARMPTSMADKVITGSLAVPQGTNPTVDAAGEIAVDTSATAGSGIRFYGDAAYTLPGYFSKSLVITGATTASDSPFWRTPWAITIRAVHCLIVGGTNVVGQLDEYDANGANAAVVDSADITCTTTNANDDGTLSNPSIDAGDYLGWHTTSVSGTNTRTIITWEFTVDGVL